MKSLAPSRRRRPSSSLLDGRAGLDLAAVLVDDVAVFREECGRRLGVALVERFDERLGVFLQRRLFLRLSRGSAAGANRATANARAAAMNPNIADLHVVLLAEYTELFITCRVPIGVTQWAAGNPQHPHERCGQSRSKKTAAETESVQTNRTAATLRCRRPRTGPPIMPDAAVPAF